MAQTAEPMQLRFQTVDAFDAYIHEAEAAMEQTPQASGPFLWCDLGSERSQQVRGGQILAQFWVGRAPIKVPNGLIHDWIGAVFIPGTTVRRYVVSDSGLR